MNEKEAWPLAVGGSVLFYRRLSLGVLASLERVHAVTLPADENGAPHRMTVNRRALEAAIIGHVLVGWQGVRDSLGNEVEFSPAAALRLPAGVRSRILKAAMEYRPPLNADAKGDALPGLPPFAAGPAEKSNVCQPTGPERAKEEGP